MTFLLDVNVLIALLDPQHIDHARASTWFRAEGRQSWATCPLTQNGVIRIVGHPKYGNTPGSPAIVAEVLQRLCSKGGHEFWPDDLSLIGTPLVDPAQILTSNQVTDIYLLALAVAKQGTLATLDRRLSSAAVDGGKEALLIIPEPRS